MFMLLRQEEMRIFNVDGIKAIKHQRSWKKISLAKDRKIMQC